ncbi:92db88ff-3675-48c1-8384-acf4c3b5d8ef [Sclerotinia trifoliorum]|uniref:92db88ff-3675-48c1-8384-acf4c3b5d8ef n=1 Tax=Sclerotinia trifoliorum TaxID=28548 RepID=A0A8H2ZJL4_9HELO|nr:92db88ff-3675-48c1-8384-acf4c3b5d8ef [Sclerotinia trifoliorum]
MASKVRSSFKPPFLPYFPSFSPHTTDKHHIKYQSQHKNSQQSTFINNCSISKPQKIHIYPHKSKCQNNPKPTSSPSVNPTFLSLNNHLWQATGNPPMLPKSTLDQAETSLARPRLAMLPKLD